MRKRTSPPKRLQHREEIRQALQEWNGNQPGAMATLRPLADEGDPAAAALLAWMDLLAETQGAAESIKSSVASVEGDQQRAAAVIQEHESKVGAERARMAAPPS